MSAGLLEFDLSEKEWLKIVRKSRLASTYHTSGNGVTSGNKKGSSKVKVY